MWALVMAIVGRISTEGFVRMHHHLGAPPDQSLRFSASMRSLKIHGAKCPHGSIETIFSGSPHWGNGPMSEAGSVLV